MAETLTAFDPLSPDYLEEPAPVLMALQREQPVFFYEPLQCWVITRYADLREAERDTASFSSRATGFIRPPADIEPLVPDLSVEEIIITLDPPDHARHRNAMAKGFGSAMLGRIEGRIVENANLLIDGFAARGHADLMAEYSVPLTMSTIVDVLGVPDDRREDYRQWSEDFFALLTPRLLDGNDGGERRPVDDEDVRARWTRLVDANRWLRDHLDWLEANPGDDIISGMMSATAEDGSPLISRSAVVRHLISLIGAGHDTTANSIAHTVHYLSTHADQRNALVADLSLAANAVEEGLRMRGSVPGNFRVTTRAVTMSGVTIPANSLVYLLVAAAGYDEEIFPDPMRFDIHRENASKHLAFGFGRHSCIGSGLARMQARVAIAELYRRLPDLAEVTGRRRKYLPLMTVTGLQNLEVEWTPSAQSREKAA